MNGVHYLSWLRTRPIQLIGLVLVVALLSAMLPVTSAAPAKAAKAADGPPIGPNGPAFYVPPANLPDDPGDLIRYRSTPFYSAPLIRSGAKAWKVLYRSSTATGDPVAVSGLVLVPRTPWSGGGPRPVVSFSPGTTGMADRCAVSRAVTVPAAHPTTLYEAPFIAMLLSRGWAVAVTDYQGLGTPGEHPYVVGNALGRNALDVVRAAQRLPVAGLSPDAPVLIWGYSEGGNAAGWATHLAPTYAPELQIEGAAFGGVPNDLRAMFATLDAGPLAGLLAMGGIGLDTAYPELDLAGYLNPVGRRLVPMITRTCLAEALVLGAFSRTSAYTTSNPIEAPAWIGRLEQNTLDNQQAPSIPMFDYHAIQDEAVAFAQARGLRDSWCAQGADLTWRAVPGEHLSGYVMVAQEAADFLADRLAGEPTAPNC